MVPQQDNRLVDEAVLSSDLSINKPVPKDVSAVVANAPMAGAQANSQELSAGQTSTVNVADYPKIADDVDLIEKEWINKIKEILNKSKGNPNLKAKELALLKQEYLQKRYNKVIA